MSRRRGQVVAAAAIAVLIGAVVVWGTVTWSRDDDAPVDPSTPRARQAVAIAQEVVPGRLLGVARDVDDGKWEIAIAQEGREYEVELSPVDLTLLRLDYD